MSSWNLTTASHQTHIVEVYVWMRMIATKDGFSCSLLSKRHGNTCYSPSTNHPLSRSHPPSLPYQWNAKLETQKKNTTKMMLICSHWEIESEFQFKLICMALCVWNNANENNQLSMENLCFALLHVTLLRFSVSLVWTVLLCLPADYASIASIKPSSKSFSFSLVSQICYYGKLTSYFSLCSFNNSLQFHFR